MEKDEVKELMTKELLHQLYKEEKLRRIKEDSQTLEGWLRLDYEDEYQVIEYSKDLQHWEDLDEVISLRTRYDSNGHITPDPRKLRITIEKIGDIRIIRN